MIDQIARQEFVGLASTMMVPLAFGLPLPVLSASSNPPGRSGCVSFARSLEAATAGDFTDQFVLAEQWDVFIVAEFPIRPGARLLRFDITGGAGIHHGTFWRAVAAVGPHDETVPHPVTGMPITVEHAEIVEGRTRVVTGLPIAGTSLTRYRMTGVLTVSLTTDEDRKPAASAAFELVE